MFVSAAKKSSGSSSTIVPTSTLSVTRPADVTLKSSSASPSVTSPPAEDPYAVWLVEQKTREKEWSKNRATKKAKMVGNESVCESSESSESRESISCQKDQFSSVKKQLEAKTEECTLLKSELRELQHANANAVKTMQESQEKIFKVSLERNKSLLLVSTT